MKSEIGVTSFNLAIVSRALTFGLGLPRSRLSMVFDMVTRINQNSSSEIAKGSSIDYLGFGD